MVGKHTVLRLFVCGSSTSSVTSFHCFHCLICQRDVFMQSRGAREFTRHFVPDKHWFPDMAYHVQQDLPVYNRLMDLLTLTSEEKTEYLAGPTVEKSEGFSFPEDLLLPCTGDDSAVPLMTIVNFITDLCRCGGT